MVFLMSILVVVRFSLKEWVNLQWPINSWFRVVPSLLVLLGSSFLSFMRGLDLTELVIGIFISQLLSFLGQNLSDLRSFVWYHVKSRFGSWVSFMVSLDSYMAHNPAECPFLLRVIKVRVFRLGWERYSHFRFWCMRV